MKHSAVRNVLGQFEPISAIERFNASYRVMEDGCWIWQKSLFYNGYSRFHADGEVSGHRWSYKNFKGEIKKTYKMAINHLCRHRACVNPDHLEYITQKENINKGDTAKRFKIQTHCKNGHEYAKTGFYLVRRSRQCKPCVMFRYHRRKNESAPH